MLYVVDHMKRTSSLLALKVFDVVSYINIKNDETLDSWKIRVCTVLDVTDVDISHKGW